MKVRVRLEQYDLIEKTNQVLVETSALFKENTLVYFEEDGKHKHEIAFGKEEITLIRKGNDFSSETRLPLCGMGKAKVHSPYGTMVMPTKLVRWERRQNRWTVEYQLLQETNVVTHMRMVWDIQMPA